MAYIDLHCHLDGSLTHEFIRQVLAEIRPRAFTDDEILRQIQAPIPCHSLSEYLTRFQLPADCMQTEKHMEEGAYTFVQSLAKDHVIYCEVRFAPTLFSNAEVTESQALEAVLQGLARGQQEYGVMTQTILCALRGFSLEQNKSTFSLARAYLGHGVCGVDLAGDESHYPTSEFGELFAHAKALELPFTIHVGECGSWQNILDAIELGAKRIGHGIAMASNLELQALCRKKQVGIELCPTSNLQTKAINSWEEYPLQEFLEHQLLATINTDNRTVSNTTMENEFSYFDIAIHKKLTENAIQCIFADDAVRHKLWQYLV